VASIDEKIRSQKELLDQHTREMVKWHFSDDTGCQFWLEKKKEFNFDPLTDVNCFDDLKKFPLFEDEWLRGGPMRRWVPQPLQNKPIYVFETGGTTGIPKSRVVVEDHWIDYELFSDTLPEESFPRGSNWLMLGPSGPRRLRLAIEHLAQHRGGICFCVDLDPRWVVKLLKKGKIDEAKEYSAHCVDQALTILSANNDIQCMFTTPKLLEALALKLMDQGSSYGNTLMGLACGKPHDPADNYKITYFAPQPRAVIEVVDFDDHNKLVDYGATGRVKLYTMTKELFVPGFLERDEGERELPHDKYPWDGVSSVRPYHVFARTTTVGVY